MLLTLLSRTLLELLGFLIRFLHRLPYFPLLLARLDRYCYTTCCALLRRIADSALGVFPVGGSGTDLVSVGVQRLARASRIGRVKKKLTYAKAKHRSYSSASLYPLPETPLHPPSTLLPSSSLVA